MTRHTRTRRRFLYLLIATLALVAFGGVYQAVAEAFDRRLSHPPGRLVDVGGRRLHLLCVGSGSPTVVLESGLGEAAGYWAWILDSVGRHTPVCAYDRAGRGWSDGRPGPQHGIAVATDLYSLLERGQIGGPIVLVGHSSGAQYARIFAGLYPEKLAGMVLLDAQPAEAFERLPDFPAFYNRFRHVLALLPSLARLGVGRLVYHGDFDDLPPQAREMQRYNYSSTRHYRSLRDEFVALPVSLTQAESVQTLGNVPLVVVTASRDAQTGWLPLQEELVELSANSLHRIVPFTHSEVVTDRAGAEVSSRAILDVVHAVRSGAQIDGSPVLRVRAGAR